MKYLVKVMICDSFREETVDAASTDEAEKKAKAQLLARIKEGPDKVLALISWVEVELS